MTRRKQPMYTRRQRELAATICAIAASNSGAWGFGEITADLGVAVGGRGQYLALAAWEFILHAGIVVDVDAEAEAMIRCGWEPTS